MPVSTVKCVYVFVCVCVCVYISTQCCVVALTCVTNALFDLYNELVRTYFC